MSGTTTITEGMRDWVDRYGWGGGVESIEEEKARIRREAEERERVSVRSGRNALQGLYEQGAVVIEQPQA